MSTDVDRKANIGETLFTVGWLEETLQKELQTKATFASYTDERIGLGQGFLSLILKVKVDWSDQDENRPRSFVVKSPTMDTFKNMDKQIDLQGEAGEKMVDQSKEMAEKMGDRVITLAHNAEVEFYKCVRGLEEQMKIPVCYHSSGMIADGVKPGALILEDLSTRGMAKTPAVGLTADSVMQVVDAFAALHAWCFEHVDRWANNQDMNMTFAKFTIQTGTDEFLKMVQMTCDSAPKDFPGALDDIIDQCKNAGVIVGYTVDQLEELLDYPQKLCAEVGMPEVLVHGDLWISNLMFEKQADGSGNDTVFKIIDWQLCHPGCFVEDVARLLLSSCTAELRREITDEVLQHYYDTLQKLMKDKPCPFTIDQLRLAYKKCFKFSSYTIFFMLPMFARQTAMLGDKPEEARKELLERTKAILEDCLAIEQELGRLKN